jgi:hypothetical protein
MEVRAQEGVEIDFGGEELPRSNMTRVFGTYPRLLPIREDKGRTEIDLPTFKDDARPPKTFPC